MKKKIKYLLFIIILFIGFPIISFASSYTSEIKDIVDAMPNTKLDGFSLINNTCQGYTSYGLGGKPAYQISGLITNSYEVDIQYKIHLNVYDADDNFLGEIVKDGEVKGKNSKNYDVLISAASNYDFDFKMIAKYSITLEVLTDVAREESIINVDYYLDNYEVSINVSNDNVYSIEESFKSVFKKYVDGIEKKIPLRYIYKRDLSSVNKKALINNILVKDYYSEKMVKGNKVLTIGERDTENNTRDYKISYDYNVGKDTISKNDEFMYFFNNTWDCNIDGVKFTITLPKTVNIEKVVLIDKDGYESSDDLEYSVDGNVITGTVDKMLDSNNVYGIKIVLPDNYFSGSTNVSGISIISLIIPLIFIVISIVITYLLTNTKSIKNHSLYPYKNMNSIEIGYLYNGKVKDNDIGTLLFNLCNDGYVEIIKTKDSYTIVKKNDYKKSNDLEKAFMDDLFKYTDQVDREQLQVAMRNMKDRILVRQDTKKNKKKLFNNSILNIKLIFWLLVIITFVLITVNTLNDYQMNYLWINLVMSGIGYGLLLKGALSRNNIMEKIIISLVSIILIISPIIFTCLEAFKLNPFNIVVYLIGVLCMIIIAIIANQLPNRTSYGRNILNVLKSYKEYLLSVDMDVIKEEMVNNRFYFYNIIPYAFVLGISDKWYDKFEKVELVRPNWYIDDEKKFDRAKFYELIKEIYSDMYFAYKK